jgi:hypothetical protein
VEGGGVLKKNRRIEQPHYDDFGSGKRNERRSIYRVEFVTLRGGSERRAVPKGSK